jgi:hypothetical protein
VAQSGSKVEKMTRRPAPSSSTTCRFRLQNKKSIVNIM